MGVVQFNQRLPALILPPWLCGLLTILICIPPRLRQQGKLCLMHVTVTQMCIWLHCNILNAICLAIVCLQNVSKCLYASQKGDVWIIFYCLSMTDVLKHIMLLESLKDVTSSIFPLPRCHTTPRHSFIQNKYMSGSIFYRRQNWDCTHTVLFYYSVYLQ